MNECLPKQTVRGRLESQSGQILCSDSTCVSTTLDAGATCFIIIFVDLKPKNILNESKLPCYSANPVKVKLGKISALFHAGSFPTLRIKLIPSNIIFPNATKKIHSTRLSPLCETKIFF